MSNRRLTALAVLAHPDDETFRAGGTLALLARRGVRVQVLCATRGEAGSCGDPPLCTPEELPAIREQELRCACSALGIDPPHLLDYHDGTLTDVDEEDAVARVLGVLRKLRPQVLLTWPLDGLSGHPDHMAVSRWAALAFEQAGGLGMAAPIALYHLAVPRSVAEALGLAQLHAIPDEDITLAVDVMDARAQKMAAIRCHRTQAGGSPILEAPEDRQLLFLGKEHFRRAAAREGRDLMQELQREQMTHAIEVEGLTKVYGRPGSGLLAVNQVSYQVHQGEVFGFLGPNGAGKKTTQRMLTTLLELTEGQIVIHGHDLASDAYPVKQQMGLVPEESKVQTELSAWDKLMSTSQLYRVPRAERAARDRACGRSLACGRNANSTQRAFPRGCAAV